MRLAIVCSAHGLGHLGRQLALAEAMPHHVEVTIFTHAPRFAKGSGCHIVPWTADVGLVQIDGLHADVEATLRALEEIVNEQAIDRLSDALKGFDLVVVDAAPPAMEAARRAGVRAKALGNFDWAQIYRHYDPLRAWSERFAQWQAPHVAGSLWPGPGMTGFRSTTALGLLGRRADPERPSALGAHERMALVGFGGFGLAGVERWMPPIDGLRYVLCPPMDRIHRSDVIFETERPFPALLAGADVVLTKPGYGILVEALAAGTPLAYLPRPGWPESPSLEAVMKARGDLELAPDPRAALEALLQRPRPACHAVDSPSIAAWVQDAR